MCGLSGGLRRRGAGTDCGRARVCVYVCVCVCVCVCGVVDVKPRSHAGHHAGGLLPFGCSGKLTTRAYGDCVCANMRVCVCAHISCWRAHTGLMQQWNQVPKNMEPGMRMQGDGAHPKMQSLIQRILATPPAWSIPPDVALTPECVDLLRRLLCADPVQRASIAQVSQWAGEGRDHPATHLWYYKCACSIAVVTL